MKIGKVLWIMICLSLIIYNIILINGRFKDASGDMEAMHGALLAFNEGKNPYLAADVE
jgi:hypothetical protein